MAEAASRPASCLTRLGEPRPPPAALTPARLAEVLAIVVINLTETLDRPGADAALIAIANSFDEHGRMATGSDSAQMLGAIGKALMRLER